MPGVLFQPAAGFSFFRGENASAPYQTFVGVNSYRRKEGIIGVPIAKRKPTSASEPTLKAIRLHAPVQRRVFSWTVTRDRLSPKLPSPEPREGEVLEEFTIDPETPSPIDTQARVFRVSGVYVYLILAPTSDYRTGANPALTLPPDADVYRDRDFEKLQ